jgi:hypothetical protein
LLQYESDPESISTFSANLFPSPNDDDKRSLIRLFANAGIAYTFQLKMTEDNDFSADVGFLRRASKFGRTGFTLGIDAGANRKRSNSRIFTVTDTFSYLVTKLDLRNADGERYCDGQIVRANHIYPIAGRIGVDKLVRSFLELTLLANLAGKPGAGNAPTVADELTFTTTINASANPSIVFTQITDAFQLVNASLNASAMRTDMHQVTVGLAISPDGMVELGPLRSYLFSGAGGGRQVTRGRRSPAPMLYVGARVTGGGSPSEVLAVTAIDQLKSRELQLIPPP